MACVQYIPSQCHDNGVESGGQTGDLMSKHPLKAPGLHLKRWGKITGANLYPCDLQVVCPAPGVRV
jgi:hypothetical protein